MKKIIAFSLTVALLAAPAALFAQDGGQEGQQQDQQQQDRNGLSGSFYRVSDLTEMSVVSPQAEPQEQQSQQGSDSGGGGGDQGGGQDGQSQGQQSGQDQPPQIGQVQDVIITRDGAVSHLLVDLDFFQGLQPGLYLAPIELFTVEQQNISLTTEDPLQELTAVEEEEQVREHIGSDSVRANQLTDWVVLDSNNADLGSIDDFVVDMQQARIVYAALSRGDVLGVGGEMYALPFDIVDFDAEQEQVQVQADDEQFEGKEGFDSDNWPEEANEEWR